jgi:hypothetical protein
MLFGAGCGGSVDEPPAGPLSVDEALTSTSGSTVTVFGALFASPGQPLRLCSAIAESYPPQCGGASLAVQGLDLGTVPHLQIAGDVSWAESAVLTGIVDNRVLTVTQR